MLKSIVRFWIWLILLNIIMNILLPEPIRFWGLIEIVLAVIAAIMVDWNVDDKDS